MKGDADKLRDTFDRVKDRMKRAWEDLTEHKERKAAGSSGESSPSKGWERTDREYPTDLDEP
jgi:hypothetical protein